MFDYGTHATLKPTNAQKNFDEPTRKGIKFENSDIYNYENKTFKMFGVYAKHQHVCE